MKHRKIDFKKIFYSCLHSFTHHLLCHNLRDLLFQVKRELNGSTLLVLPFQLLVVLYPQFQGYRGLLPIVLLSELYSHTCVLGKESVVQQVLDGVPGGRKSEAQTPAQMCILHTFGIN